jgi:ectoine hydroxylase-related dioxygenase (phytanoyl-CoA dioxygenase family)
MHIDSIAKKLFLTFKFLLKDFSYKMRRLIYIERSKILPELSENGYYVINNFLDSDTCEKIITDIDTFITKYPKEVYDVKNKNSDFRLWGFEKYSINAKNFLEDERLKKIVINYDTLSVINNSFVLAAKLVHTKDFLGSGGGEWHRDRTFRKFKYCKALVYLNDVNDNNGPFQYIRGSHKLSFLIKNFIKKNYDYSKNFFLDKEIEINFSNKISTFCKKRGTAIIFDGTGIHRGKPINQGKRYAITNYYRQSDEEFPFKMINRKK